MVREMLMGLTSVKYRAMEEYFNEIVSILRNFELSGFFKFIFTEAFWRDLSSYCLLLEHYIR
jgi:hypothetical protein